MSGPQRLAIAVALDKGHGRIEERTVTVARAVDWLAGEHRFPGELRWPDAAAVIRAAARAGLTERGRFETRYTVSSAALHAASCPSTTVVSMTWLACAVSVNRGGGGYGGFGLAGRIVAVV